MVKENSNVNIESIAPRVLFIHTASGARNIHSTLLSCFKSSAGELSNFSRLSRRVEADFKTLSRYISTIVKDLPAALSD